MKKLSIFIVSVVVVLVVADLLFGVVMTFQKKIGLKGDYKPIEYVIKQCNEDVLIMGSSVVLNSLNPTIIEDSLGMSCFNAGASSQTPYYYHTILNCILKRYCPKLIVLGIRTAEFDSEDQLQYNILVPYYHTGYSEMDSVLERKNSYEKYLLHSNLYRYNTIWFRILLYNFFGDYERGEKGFIAHEKPAMLPKMTQYNGVSRYVSVAKENLFRDFIAICKQNNIKLIVYTPPVYSEFKNTPATVQRVVEICKETDVPYYNDMSNNQFISQQDLFYDQVHFNKYGAVAYTQMFINRLRSELKRNN